MKQNLPNLNKRTLIRWKVYFDRSRMYIGYIQFFLIGIVAIKSFKDNALTDWVFKYAVVSIPIALFLFVALSLLLGYFDSKLGFREEEQRNLARSNPIMMEMLDQIKELNRKIDEMEKRNDLKN